MPATRIAPLYAAVLAAFVVSRAASFLVLTVATEPQPYLDYARAVRDTSVADFYRSGRPEYPPLTAVFLVPPLWLADAPFDLGRLVADRRRTADHPAAARYEAALGLQLLAVDALLAGAVYAAARRLYPDEEPVTRAARVGLYVGASAAFAPVWFDRLDAVVGLSAVLALLAFAGGRTALAYAVLLAGAAFKLVPGLLLPAVVLAAAAADRAAGRTFGRAVVRQAAIAGGMLLLGVAITALLVGGGAFSFLAPHAARGVQPESTYGPPVRLADPDSRVVFNYGGFHLAGPLADRVAPLTTLIVGVLLLAAVAAAGRVFWRRTAGPPGRVELGRLLVAACVLTWLAFILGSKVGSPQYVIWLTPLVPLLPLADAGGRRWAAWFVGLCVLSNLVYPAAAGTVTGPMVGGDPPTWAGSTPLGLGLVAAKAAVTAGLACRLGVRLWRDGLREVKPEASASAGIR